MDGAAGPEGQAPGFYAACRASVLQDRRVVVAALFSSLVGATGQGLMALCAGLLAKRVATGVGPLLPFAAAGLAGALIKSGAAVVSARLEADVAGRFGGALRDRVARGLLVRGANRGGAADVARIGTAVREAEQAFAGGALTGARAALGLVPLVLVLLFVAPRASMLAVLAFGTFAIALSRLRKEVRAREEAALARAAGVEEEVDDLVRHVDLFRTYGTGARARRALSALGDALTRATAAARATRAGASGGSEVTAALALVLVVAAIERGLVPLAGGELVLFLSVFFMAYRPVRDLGDARAALRRGDVAMDALAPFLGDTEPGDDATPREPIAGALEARAFGATGTDVAVSFSVAPGEVVALVGPTGAGKTSLLRALLGLVPCRGELRYATRDVTCAAPGPSLRPFAWAPQDAPVLSGSLRENLLLGGERLDEATHVLSLLAGPALADELATSALGAGGRTLSGGERSWLAVARAVATGMPVLLLDEPTASLDDDAERRFVAALATLRQDRAVLVVTHRQRTAAAADRVIDVTALER